MLANMVPPRLESLRDSKFPARPETTDGQIKDLSATPRLTDTLPIPAEVAAEMQQMREALQAMAGLMRTTNETMAQLQRQVRLLEKVTPAQASAINKAIRGRAVELCAIYMMRGDGCDKAVASAIRKAIKLRFGANAAKELPRCEYEVAMAQVNGWDDYKTMKEIKGRMNK